MVRWSRRARDDLKAIHDRIATDSPITAKSLVRQILSKTGTLDSVTHRGRAVPEVNDESVREIPVSAWRVIYQVRNDQVFIVALIHKRRSPPAQDFDP
jgi:toxin ParE1/3/4